MVNQTSLPSTANLVPLCYWPEGRVEMNGHDSGSATCGFEVVDFGSSPRKVRCSPNPNFRNAPDSISYHASVVSPP